MNFSKAKKLHVSLEKELDRLSRFLSKKFDRDILVSPTTDGLCVMFEDQEMTGITLDEFERMAKEPGFDTRSIITTL